MMERSELDHIVVAAASLDAGVAWVEERLGARPVAGGQHVAMGTHNALLRLGPRCYLEVIAIDPAGQAPARPRWFSLDQPETRARLAASPALITWVVRTPSLASACARVPDLSEILPMTRNAYRWMISVPDDGALAWGGILPTAIQWEPGDDGVVHHPCDALPESGCELTSLRLSHPAAVLGTSGIVALFRELRIAGPVDLKSGPKSLAAVIRSPRGEVTLG
jgi:catechol 2,3-dioxygenase-like lactoylglutathione lyase family enzyme